MSVDVTYPHELALLPPKTNYNNPTFTDTLLKARVELAELKGYSFSMQNPMLLGSPTIIKESVASSNIENINTTIIDVLQNQLFPEIERREPDKEVLRYRDAILWGYENIKSYALSTRLILGIHKKLIPASHGSYRRHQNQIINSDTKEVLYTPPIASDIPRLMGNWENFVNSDNEIDPLVKCAIAHYQFEAIHPFGDGNGRAGRILMVLQLVNEDIVTLPILYISGYINKNRSQYYKLLRAITARNEWNEFIRFMLEGFYRQAKETKETLLKVMGLFSSFKDKLRKEHKKVYSADLVEALFKYPIITPVKLATEVGLHYTTASRYLLELSRAKLLRETRHGKYHFFINDGLLRLLKK